MLALTVLPTLSVYEIVALGVAYTIGAAAVQRKLSNPKKTRALQDQIKIRSKELNEMIKRDAPKEEISAKQKEMMPLVKQSMSLNMKSTIVLIPSFLVVYYLILPFLFSSLGTDSVSFSLFNTAFSLQYRGLFFVVVFVLGLITSVSILLYDRRRAKLDTKAKLAAEGISE